MARVPSWTELCLVVDQLSKLQKECYDSVHELLDLGLPELDRKIRYLTSRPNENPLLFGLQSDPLQGSNPVHKTYAPPEAPNITTLPVKKTAEPITNVDIATATTSAPIVDPAARIASTAQPCHAHPPRPISKDPHSVKDQEAPVVKSVPVAKSKNCRTKGPTANGAASGPTNGHKKSLKDLEHLRAPKMPLCEYLRKNRPDILMSVEARSSYIRKITEERKSLRAHRIISSLERIRISSRGRKKSHQHQKARQSAQMPQRAMRDFGAPDYCVRHKQSEREMKQLTLRNYRRLPEVKKQKLEEINKHLKEQYYKNRQLYGRMLLNNFKNGIINYPLRSSYDDRSITSSQSEYSMSQSADTACSLDPYY